MKYHFIDINDNIINTLYHISQIKYILIENVGVPEYFLSYDNTNNIVRTERFYPINNAITSNSNKHKWTVKV